MPLRLDLSAGDFRKQFDAFLATKREVSADVDAAARDIIDDVTTRGDAALVELSKRFDRVDLASAGLRVSAEEIAKAPTSCEKKALDALKFARDRIEAYHLRQKPKDERFTDALGVELG